MKHFVPTCRRRGAVLVMAALLMVVIFGFAALSLDIGYVALAKSQLENATDAAALAGAAELTTGGDEGDARDAAEAVAFENFVAQQPLVIDKKKDVHAGYWDPDTGTFSLTTGTGEPKNAVRVVGQLSSVRGNALQLFFAPVIGHKETGMQSTSIATIKSPRTRDIMLVIDCSGSMGDNNRMSLTRAAAKELVAEIGEQDRVGLAVYSYEAAGVKTGHLENSLSYDIAAVDNRIGQLADGLYLSGTNIAGGMRVAIEEFLAHPRVDVHGDPVVQLMVLMTDGHANIAEAPGTEPFQSIDIYAQKAADEGILIHGITLGEDADQVGIRSAAQITGGYFDHVNDGDSTTLKRIYSNIGLGFGTPRLVK